MKNKMTNDEKIITAAIHYDDGKEYLFQKCYGVSTGFVIGVFRHPYASSILPLNPKYKSETAPFECDDYKVVQGFITSLGRFVGRKEAYNIALKAGQIDECNGVEGELYSEDLYPEQMYNDKGEKIE